MQNVSVAASPALSARVVAEQNPDESVLELMLGRISLPPSSPQITSFSDAGEEMRLEDLGSISARTSGVALDATRQNYDSAKKLDDEAERERLEALKAHVPACLSNVLSVAPAAVTARMNVLSLQNSNLIIIPHCLSKFPALSKLDLSLNRLESVDSAFLLNALPQLQDLNLSNNRIRNIAQIQELGRHSCLTSLDLSCNPLQNSGQRVLLLQLFLRDNMQALLFSNPLKPLSEMNDEDLSAITCGGKSASFSNILSSERPGSIIIKGIHPSKDRPSTAKAKFSKQIIYADMNLAAVPRPCAFPQLQVLNGSPLTVDIMDLAAISELEMLSARKSNLRTELPKRRSTGIAAQTKEKWLVFDPDVKDVVAQQARGTTYEKQLPLLLQKTRSRFTKYAQRDLNRRVKHFIQSGDLGFTLYDSDNDSEDEAGGIKPLQGPSATATDSTESRDLLDDLGTVQWTRVSVRSTSPSLFADSSFDVYSNRKSASICVQETENKTGTFIEDQEEVLNFSIAHKASSTISSILARVNANIRARNGKWVEPRDHATSGQLPVAVNLNDNANSVLKASIDAKTAIAILFPEEYDSDSSVLKTKTQVDPNDLSPTSNPGTSLSPSTSPRAKISKSIVNTKSVNPKSQLHNVQPPKDERNVWMYEPTLKSMDLAAATRAAASARAAALSVKLADSSAADDKTTLITVRLPDYQSTAFKAMRSTRLDQLHAATAAAFSIESEFVFSLPYPKKLLLQQNVSLDELGLIPEGLLLVVFSDERDTFRVSSEQNASGNKVCLGNILEMELKEQQNITKSVQSHIVTHHPKVANLLLDVSAAKNTPAASAKMSADDGGEVSAVLSAVDGLFLKTNVELQTISNSSRTDMPIEAMKKMVRIEAAQEQRLLDREHEKQQHQQHVKRLDSINAGTSRAAVQRASIALLHKSENQTEHSNTAPTKIACAASENAAPATSITSISPRKKIGAAAGSSVRPRSSTGMRPIVGFDYYRKSMDTVEDIERKSSLGIPRDKYVETLIGCIDARHAAKTEPKLLSRYLDRFVDQELKYEESRRVQSSNLDYLIQANSFGRESSVAIDSSGKRVEYPERLRSAAAADEARRLKAIAASRVPVHDRLPVATPTLPKKETSLRRMNFKRSA